MLGMAPTGTPEKLFLRATNVSKFDIEISERITIKFFLMSMQDLIKFINKFTVLQKHFTLNRFLYSGVLLVFLRFVLVANL